MLSACLIRLTASSHDQQDLAPLVAPLLGLESALNCSPYLWVPTCQAKARRYNELKSFE